MPYGRIASHVVTADGTGTPRGPFDQDRPPPAPPAPPGHAGTPGDETLPGGTPPGGIAAELGAAFRRLRPQGSDRWNFAAAFARLEERYGRPSPAGDLEAAGTDPGGEAPPAGGPVGGGEAVPDRSRLHRLADRYVTERLEAWIADLATAAADRATAAALAREHGSIAEGFDAAVEALRFLGARVERLEDAAGRRRDPVDAVGTLAPPPQLAAWTAPVVGWVRGARPPGPVLHGECGDGELVAALAAAGVAARGVEPRGAAAWRAADRGAAVHVGGVAELLASLPEGSLGGLVLSGVVDRAPLDELVALVGTATARLAPGAPLVVLGTWPEAAATAWSAAAGDLLPGRPLHPETWELLLARAGYADVGRLGPEGPADPGSFAVKAKMP